MVKKGGFQALRYIKLSLYKSIITQSKISKVVLNIRVSYTPLKLYEKRPSY